MKINLLSFAALFLIIINICILPSFAQSGKYDDRVWSVVKVEPNNFKETKTNNSWTPAEQVDRFLNLMDGITVSANFRPKPTTNSTQSETSVDVHPSNNNIVFCSANATNWPVTTLYGTGVYWSLNGSTSWSGTDNPATLPGFGSNSGDPCSIIGPDGRFYENYINNSYGQSVSVSTNNGTNWTTYTVAPNPGYLADKNHYMVDKESGSPYQSRSYCAFTDFSGSNDGDVVLRYSTNYGQAWSSSINISSSLSAFNQGVNIQTGPNGEVYATWAVYTGSSDYEDGIGFAKSTNGGVTWSAATYAYFHTDFGIRGNLSSKNGIRVASFPSMSVDRSGGPYNGYIYITWPQRGVSPAGSDPDIVLIKSSNGGTTWSSPIRVNNDPLNNGKDQYYPWCTVDQSTGQLMIVFYDSRDVVNSQANVYMARSLDGGTTFENFLVSDQPHTPSPIAGLASGYAGDYIGVAAHNNAAYPYWGDNRTGNYQGWMAKVTFGPPCPIDPAYNPNPVNGATDISINLSNISWSNGAGATQCEVWFGETGSMAKVYDGSLITSWTISGPLSYGTTYNWQIVGKDGTCSVSSPLWTFTTEQNPNLVIDTIKVYPLNINYWTGTCNSSSKTQVSLVDADGNGFAGWMVFDVSLIPDDATINSIKFHAYLYANNYPYWSITPMGNVNPVTGSASTIYTQVSNNYLQGTAYSYNEESGDLPLGWLQRTLNEGGAASDMQNSLSQDWFALGVYEWENGTTYYVNFYGWAQTNRPYLEVIYEYININVVDPTNVSAAPVTSSQIDIGFTPNPSNNNVVVVWNLTGTFNTPAGTPPAIGQPFAGGTLLYNGVTSPVNHSGLIPLTTYYYKLFSYNGINYSPGVAVNAATLDLRQAAVDFPVVVRDNVGLISSINFGLDLTATDDIDPALGEAGLPGPPPENAYYAAWVLPDGITQSYYDYRAPGDPPAFPFTGNKQYDIKFQSTDYPITISWNLPSTIAQTSTIMDPFGGIFVNASFSGTDSVVVTLEALTSLEVSIDYNNIDSIQTFELNVLVQNGWNIVSAPGFNPDGMDVTNWWPDLTGTVWGFNGTVYVAESTTTPGEGYWMKNTVAETYDYAAIEVVPHAPITGHTNWNIIGVYEDPAAESGITTNPSGQRTGTIWGFNGTVYVDMTGGTLQPGYGYWIKLLTACDIIIPEPPLSKGSGEVAEYFKSDWGRIVMTDAAGISYTLYAVKGEVDLDQYEMPPAMPGGMFDIRYSSGRVAEDINSSVKTIDMQGITYPLTVRVEGMDMRLMDETGKQLNVNLKDGEDVVIENSTINKLMVTGELIPEEYSLEQNYPNPFNPSTVIEFSLPEEVANVKLTIYNALGEKVAELVNSSLIAGKYQYRWNAGGVATGMYIYELRTDKFVSVKKMLFLK